ncbi:hypothetical protein L596_028896 [Steinernema carpocapsae]|uniref:7TM GPCR serpentine receptor class x (Srx) domain-containing protein n=1 Tax=Steinernema carpocapsae TaxID=34508 RepID=A0A4U5LZP3_STECR|nr:hypothetical protein L596_028896 [Steinernema carpocapsae]
MLPTFKLPYVEYAELALDIIAPFVTTYFLFLLQRPVFHKNLRILLAHFSISLGLMTLLRIAILVDSMTSRLMLGGHGTFWVHLFHNGFVLALLDASVLMAGERFIATIFVDRYELVSFWPITVAMCAVMTGINMYISYYTLLRGQNAVLTPSGEFSLDHAQYNMDIINSLIVLTVLNVIGVLVSSFAQSQAASP